MRDSAAKRELILQTAAKLFVENGYRTTTLAMVARESGAAIGSITNFFGEKGQLAIAVHDRAADRLLQDSGAALNAHGLDIPAGIVALLSIYRDWIEQFPDQVRLIGMLEGNIALPNGGLRQRLEGALSEWAAPLIAAGIVAERTPAQLYAVIMAPMISAPMSGAGFEDRKASDIWFRLLVDLAVGGITPPRDLSVSKVEGDIPHRPRRARPTATVEPDQGEFKI